MKSTSAGTYYPGSISQRKVITAWTTRIREINTEKGFRDNPDYPDPGFGEAMMLLTSEVSEAFEAYRDHGLADQTGTPGGGGLPKPEGAGSELADVFIRLLYYCDLFGIDLVHETERKLAYNATREYRHGGKLL